MADLRDIKRVLQEHLAKPVSGFGIGSLGAIAEFHRDDGEPLAFVASDGLTVATHRGAIGVSPRDQTTPLAYETLGGRPGRWQHGVAFCVPDALAISRRRAVLTEIGPDEKAIREEDRDDVLFDMGLGALNIDFCIRTGEPALIALLRKQVGRPVLVRESPAMAAILDANPHRVALSRLGRIEVYQAIGRTRTPDGPHTHVLPKLLKSGRTHSANIPIPAGYLPCLSLYPAIPTSDANGNGKQFRRSEHNEFQALLAKWGNRAYYSEKRRLIESLQRNMPAANYRVIDSRLGRTAVRVALRQLRAEGAYDETVLGPWIDHFDTPAGRNTAL